MRQVIVFTVCLFISGAISAQNKTTTTKTTKTETVTKTTKTVHGSAIGGFIHDARRHPIVGVEAFIYQADSSIVASGYTDAMGYYETNGVLPGKYDLKIVYPSSKAIIVKGVPIKSGVTQVSLNANPPDTDTTLLYTDLVPKVEKKKTEKKKA